MAQLGLDIQNRVAELKLRAERKAGDLLLSPIIKPGRPSEKSLHDERVLLSNLGVTEIQSHRWQLEARLGELLKDQGFGEYGGDRKSSSMPLLEDLGIEPMQSSRWNIGHEILAARGQQTDATYRYMACISAGKDNGVLSWWGFPSTARR